MAGDGPAFDSVVRFEGRRYWQAAGHQPFAATTPQPILTVMEITLSPRRVAWALAVVAAALVAVHIAFEALHHAYDITLIHDLQLRVSLDEEASVPALFSSVLLLLCAGLLAAIAWVPGTARRASWAVLAGVFLFLALDEAVAIHEEIIELMKPRTGGSGYLYFVWVVPYGIATAVLAAAFLPFLGSLPRRFATLFVLAGGLFVLGAIGFEMLGGKVAEASGYETFAYTALSTAEESLEMAGVIVFAYALLAYIAGELPGLSVRVGAAEVEDRAVVAAAPMAGSPPGESAPGEGTTRAPGLSLE